MYCDTVAVSKVSLEGLYDYIKTNLIVKYHAYRMVLNMDEYSGIIFLLKFNFFYVFLDKPQTKQA